MKVLVTGGVGYLGSVLCPMLLAQGHEVLLFDAFLWGVKSILHFVSDPRLEVIKGDVRERGALRPHVARADTVVHLAAIVGYPACAADPPLAAGTNVLRTRNVVALCSEDQFLVFASTGRTYGEVDGVCPEDAPFNPLTLYGRRLRFEIPSGLRNVSPSGGAKTEASSLAPRILPSLPGTPTIWTQK